MLGVADIVIQTKSFMLSVVIQNVVMLGVVKLCQSQQYSGAPERCLTWVGSGLTYKH
jgi:hypothetical protein